MNMYLSNPREQPKADFGGCRLPALTFGWVMQTAPDVEVGRTVRKLIPSSGSQLELGTARAGRGSIERGVTSASLDVGPQPNHIRGAHRIHV